MAVTAPERLTLRCYGVGFGDCFLLTFHYAGRTGDRHVLIDFGSTQRPPNARRDLMKLIARDIAAVVGPRLHVLVATHRHADHISGFATNKAGTGTGDIIARLQPQLVVQPWTERPDAPADFIGTGTSMKAADDALRLALTRMSAVAASASREARHLPDSVRKAIRFVAANGISNRSAVENLAAMGAKTKAAYVRYGMKVAAFKSLLPGVSVSILGPPTIKQKADVLDQKPTNRAEYWHFARFWAMRAADAVSPASEVLFPHARSHKSLRSMPVEDRWFVRRLRAVRAGQLLGLVRSMDDALNNTSVILLFEAGGKKLLVPGDAQWENWELALNRDAAALRDVDVYKVGHHGSLNATPKSLWRNFARRSEKVDARDRLVTVMSTRSDSLHGHEENDSEVPRRTLVTELKRFSTHRSTQELEAEGGLVLRIEVEL